MAKKKRNTIPNPVGAPPVFSTVEDFEREVNKYFTHILGEYKDVEVPDPEDPRGFTIVREWIRKPEPPTITGLCLYLGFESRQSFFDYKQRTQFSYAVKRARMRIECEYEKRLHSTTPTGAIFSLKNLGWADQQAVDHTTGGMPINAHEVIFKDYSKPAKKK